MAQKQLPTFHALTNSYPGRVNRIITKIAVCDAFDPQNPPDELPPLAETDALWDTGATSSVITPAVVRALELVPSGRTITNHGGGASEHNTFIVNLTLPNGVGFTGVRVTELEKVVDNFGMIIGMDVISFGDFSITNYENKTCFSFRVPSQGSVDFVKEYNAKLRAAVPGNALCPCGSKIKFKKCHGATS